MEDVFRQINDLHEHLKDKDASMIDPVEFGFLKGAVDTLRQQVAEIKQEQQRIDEKLDRVLARLDEAKGGWRMLMLLGGGAGSVGAALGAWLTGGPK
jgi:FtsZ-binding cell division protein ZapB